MIIKSLQIKKIMADNGMTICKLAKLAGMQPANLGRIIRNGRCSIPSAGKIARALGVDLETIMEEE